MSVSVYRRLTKLGIRFYSRENKLVWEAPKGVVTPTILAELKSHKESLLELLNISTAERSRALPLSYAQERLWYLAQIGYSRLYHIPIMFSITGTLDLKALQRALNHLVARHESLRTAFRTAKGEVTQVIDEEARVEIEKSDLRRLKPDQRHIEMQAIIHDFIERSFDLEKAPLIRAALIQTDDVSKMLAICMHHIISDGWSTGIFVRELTDCYAAYTQGQEPQLEPLSVHYADYAAWQRRVLTSERLEPELEYWRSHLRSCQDLDLPTDFVRPRQMSGAGGSVRAAVRGNEVERWKKTCQQAQVTLYALFLSGVYSLLRKYSRQSDICIGTLAANRNHWETENVIGFFVNTLVVRFSPDKISARELLAMARAEVAEAQDHQNVPFEKIIEAVEVKRDPASNPIFQALVNYVNTRPQALKLGDCHVEDVEPPEGVAKFDLTFALADKADGSLVVTIEYSRDLYERETIERMSRHLLRALSGLVEEGDKEIDEIELMSTEEREQVLVEWNRTQYDFGSHTSLQQLFEKQVEETPYAIAVCCGGRQLGYAELNARANQVAHRLRKLGVRAETPVGLCLERNVEMVVGLLGILKAGAPYVPIDVNCPGERLSYMLEDVQAQALVTHASVLARLPEIRTAVLCLDEQWKGFGGESSANPIVDVERENLAYVIYTSGSTGKPKGVGVTHGNLSNFLFAMDRALGNKPAGVWLAVTNVTFDISILELLWTLANGFRVVLADVLTWESVAEETSAEVTHLQCTPSAMQLLLSTTHGRKMLSSVKNLLLGGEALPTPLAEELKRLTSARICNMYGPTETTIWSTMYELAQWSGGTIPIGHPIANTQLYVLDEEMLPLPVGVAGELYIGGDGLARGYVKRPDLTAQKFVPDPFAREEGRRLYRTGDWVKWSAEGNVEFLGRIDHQVKHHGFRIELGEIESVLLEQPGVEAAAVIAKTINNGLQLVGYYMPGSETPKTVELKKGLSSKLPDYMIPGLFVAVSELPLTTNGKIDRRELMAREVSISTSQEYVGPRNDLEVAIARCWSEVLGVEKIGIRDNFYDLGGHSLLAVQLVNKMNLAAVQCSIRDLHDHSTIESLADHLRLSRAQQDAHAPAQDESFPLLPVQLQAIHAEFQKGKGCTKLTPTFIDLAEDVNESALVQALDAWYKQTIFSVRFKSENEQWRQFYERRSTYDYCPIREFNLDGAVTDEELVQEVVKIVYEMGRAIDIFSGPTLQVGLLRKQGRLKYMLWINDHLLIDNISFFMLFTNFKLAYKQINERDTVWFPVDTIIGRWAAHLTELAHQERLLQEVGFWKSHFSVPVPNTETFAETNAGQGAIELEHRVQQLDKTTSQKVLAFLVQQGFSFEEACLGNFLWAFKSCFQDDPALLCMVGNGRDRQVEKIDLSQGMGWFSISYPAQFQLSASSGHIEFLRDIVRQHDRYSDIKEHYGALRYLNHTAGKELGEVEDWTSSVVFNCLGEVTTPNGKDDVVRLTGTCMKVHIEFDRREQQQRRFAPNNGGQRVRSPLRRVSFSLSDGAIQIIFSFCKEKVDSQAVENLLQAIQQSFAGLVS